MGHSIPVLFAAVDASVSFPPGTSCGAAYDWPGFNALFERGQLWMHSSRNWWHLGEVERLTHELGIAGLEFLASECVTVAAGELGAVVDALRALFAHLVVGAGAAADELRAVVPLRDDGAPGAPIPDSAASFACFLVSLAAVATEARDAGMSLLWVQPQP